LVLPGRARSIGNWRSLAVNNGRSEDTLTCAIGVGSGRDDGTGRAFQARDRWGHIGATSGPRTTGSQRTTTVTSGPASCQFTSHIRPDSAGRRQRPAVPDTEEVTGSNPVAPTTVLAGHSVLGPGRLAPLLAGPRWGRGPAAPSTLVAPSRPVHWPSGSTTTTQGGHALGRDATTPGPGPPRLDPCSHAWLSRQPPATLTPDRPPLAGQRWSVTAASARA
jgi:hypothetical protein